mmetsp:Transcript_61080/g.192094  ORF Transcript_61080/g.192094 Transcript_61080/m.192094 type:complete len:203 (-) Transcript_61080:699-1307(-)
MAPTACRRRCATEGGSAAASTGRRPRTLHKALKLGEANLPVRVHPCQRPGPRAGPAPRLRRFLGGVAVHDLAEALLRDARSALPQDIEGLPHCHAVPVDVLRERPEHSVVGATLSFASSSAGGGLEPCGRKRRQRCRGEPDLRARGHTALDRTTDWLYLEHVHQLSSRLPPLICETRREAGLAAETHHSIRVIENPCLAPRS